MKRVARLLFAAALLALSAGGARAQQYFWGNYAGLPGSAGSQDGTGSTALFNNPMATAVDNNGNVYVADTSNNTIRKITPAGVVTTLAGTAGVAGSADGTGGAALFNHPTGLAVTGDGDTIYVADSYNYTIRQVTSAGVVTTLAGSPGVSGDIDGTGSGAAFGNPVAVATDGSGNIYVADSSNNTIRKVTSGGVVTTLAGSPGQAGSSDGAGSGASFNNPSGIATTGGLIYVADTSNHTIRQVTTAGVVTTPAGAPVLFGSTNGTGGAAQFYYPSGLALDAGGNLYIADTFNQTIRVMTPSGSVTTLAGTATTTTVGKAGDTNGTGTAATFNSPTGVAVDGSGNVYVADSANNTIRKISSGVVTTFAGGAHWGVNSNLVTTIGTAALFDSPMGIAADSSGNVYVADTQNHMIREIAANVSSTNTALKVTDFAGAENSSIQGSPGSGNGAGAAASFYYPGGIAADGVGNLYVADTFNQIIRKIVISTDAVTTLCGTAGTIGSADGTTAAAQFNYPSGIAANSAGTFIYVADTYNHTIRQVTSAGVVTTIAGTANTAGSTDGAGSAALFDYPSGVVVDGSGNVYVADSGNCTIRKLTNSSGTWTSTTMAGSAGVAGSADGTGSAASFNNPTGLSIDSSNNIYVADTGNHTIRMVTPAGVVTTIGGTAGVPGGVDGIGTAAQFSSPSGVVVTSAGLYVVDGGNNRVSLGSIAGTLPATSIAGTTATLNGEANANGVANGVEFQYWKPTTGTTLPTVLTTTPQSISGASFGAVSANLTGLTANTTYDYQLVLLVNGAPTYYGSDQTFTTLPTSAPTISNMTLAAATQGVAYSAQITVSAGVGGSPTSWGASPLPAGLSVNPLTGVISGTPTATGTTSVTLSATNAAGTGTKALSLVVNALSFPTFTTLTAYAVEGSNFSYNITSANSPTSYGAANLPDGLTINSLTGAIMGEPQVSGTFTPTISATNSAGTGSATLNLIVLPPYTWSNYAGAPQVSGSTDGSAVGVGLLDNPLGCVTDSNGNVYVADERNDLIREITPAGVMTTFAGTAGKQGSTDGAGSAARFDGPSAMTIDSDNNLYVADTYNCTIRKITPAGVVTTVAGTAGTIGSADGTGGAASFYYPEGIAIDGSNNLYVADAYNCTIRKITPAGVVTTVAGTAGTIGSADGTGGAASFYYPEGIAIDGSNNLYVADTYNCTIRKITPAGVVTTVAGTAEAIGSANGTGGAASFYYPGGLTVDPGSGNIFVADTYNCAIRELTPAGVVTTLAGGTYGSGDGTGAAAQFGYPVGITADGDGNLDVADSGNDTIRTITSAAVVTTLMGAPEIPGSSNGVKGTVPLFNVPERIAVDGNDDIYVADTGNDVIREVTLAGVVSTIAGTAGATGTTDGTGSAIRFHTPTDLAFDTNGNLFVADSGNDTIRKLTYASGTGWSSTTFAGTAAVSGSNNGTGTAASFNTPTGLAIDTSNNIYVADTANDVIREITSAGVVTTLAGTVGVAGSTNGTGTAAKFKTPTGVTVDASGNVYVADEGNDLIREVTPAGVVTTVAGTAGTAGAFDAIGTAAQFSNPYGITIDANGFLYVADADNEAIRKITPLGTNWMVTTIGGVSGGFGDTSGVGTAAEFAAPVGVAVDAGGNAFVGDSFNDRISIGAAILPPVITSGLSASGAENSAFTYDITATPMPTPFSSYNATGLPAGLSVDLATGAITGTPTAGGTFSPTLSATNLAGTGTATLDLTLSGSPTPYQIWQSANFNSTQLANTAISGDTATPANDGVTNLMKYALGLTALQSYNPGSSSLPSVQVQNNYLTLTFNGTATDVIYTVQATSDLTGTWTTIQTFPSGAAPGLVTVKDTSPLSTTSPRFMRLQVTGP